MRRFLTRRRSAAAVPITVGTALLLAACGSGAPHQVAQPVAQQAPAPAPAPAAPTDESTAKLVKAVVDYLEAQPKSQATSDNGDRPAVKKAVQAVQAVQAAQAAQAAQEAPQAAAAAVKKPDSEAPIEASVNSTGGESHGAAPALQTDQQRYDALNGATDTGVTKDAIKIGSINMHGMALSNVITLPIVRGDLAAVSAINDRGGVLGRRMSITDCDDGPGEVSRTKACIKKLVGEDKIFSLVSGETWGTASIHDDLNQYRLPYVGAWAYSQTEWQDPFMFPTHMSMIHEAMAGAHWAANVIKPKTYGLICLTSPEMQFSCSQVQKIMDASGSKLVKKLDVGISETSMSSGVLALRAAAPEHIIHYVINPATMVKFMFESAQQGYYPPKGISGNHLASEALGTFFGSWPAGRYWTNTTYKMWGTEFTQTMMKYARANMGVNHHIVQAGYTGVNIFAQAAKELGPNLTRERLMAELGNGTVWHSDASLDQKFSYVPSERTGGNWNHDQGQGREFMYKLTDANTVATKPDGTPSGWELAEQGVIYTDH